MDITLKQISLKDDLQGLTFLKDISNEDEDFYESPVPSSINEYLYTGFLKLSEDERKENKCYRYWILLDEKIVGYSDIKINDNKADIGIILSKNNRGKHIGYIAMKLLLKEAKDTLNIKDILITTKSNNIKMQKLCEELGANLISKGDDFKYNIK